jgi:hypothetical protein
MLRIKALNESSSESGSSDSSNSSEVHLSREAQEQHLHFLYQEALQFLKNGQDIKAKENLISLLEKLKNVPEDQPFTSGEQLKFLACKNLGLIESSDIDYFLDALGIDASDVNLWIKTGCRAFDTLQDYQLARGCFEAAHILSPMNWIVIDKLLDTYFVLNDLFSVVKLSVESLRLDPEFKKAKVLLYESCRLTPPWKEHVPDDLKPLSNRLHKDCLDCYKKTINKLRILKMKRKEKAEDDQAARQSKRPKLDLTMEYADDIMKVIGTKILKIYEHMQKDAVSLVTVIDVAMEEDEEEGNEDSEGNPVTAKQQDVTNTEKGDKSSNSQNEPGREAATSSNDKNSCWQENSTKKENILESDSKLQKSIEEAPKDQPLDEGSQSNNLRAALDSVALTEFVDDSQLMETDGSQEFIETETKTQKDFCQQYNIEESSREARNEIGQLLCYLLDKIDPVTALQNDSSSKQSLKDQQENNSNNSQDKSNSEGSKQEKNSNEQSSEDTSSEDSDEDSESEEESEIEQVSVRDLEKQIFNNFLDQIWDIKVASNTKILEIIHCFLIEMSKKGTGIVVPPSFTKLYDIYRKCRPTPQSFNLIVGSNVSVDDIYMTLTANELVYRPVDEYFLSRLLPQLEDILDEEKFNAFLIRLFFLRGTKGNQPEYLPQVIEMLEKQKKPARIPATNQVIISVSSIKSLMLGLGKCSGDVNVMIKNACTGPQRTRSGRLLKQPERFDTVRYVNMIKCPSVPKTLKKTK